MHLSSDWSGIVCHFFCSYHILTSSVINYWTEERRCGNMKSILMNWSQIPEKKKFLSFCRDQPQTSGQSIIWLSRAYHVFRSRELKQRRRAPTGRRVFKYELIIYKRNSPLLFSAPMALERFSTKYAMTAFNSKWEFEKLGVVVHFPQTPQNLAILRSCLVEDGNWKKCSKIYNKRTQLLFCSSNLLLGGVFVAVVVVVCLSSLFSLVKGRLLAECVRRH